MNEADILASRTKTLSAKQYVWFLFAFTFLTALTVGGIKLTEILQ